MSDDMKNNSGRLESEKYGGRYWCIKVSENISLDGEIYVMADRIETSITGDLVCFRGDDEITLCVACGGWSVFYAASVFDGHAVAVEHWG